MTTTKRIHLRRTRGWKMPSNTVYVGRPTRWGSPFPVQAEVLREASVRAYEEWLVRKLKREPHFLDPLIGKNLACWCPLDKLCHADILLKYIGEIEARKVSEALVEQEDVIQEG